MSFGISFVKPKYVAKAKLCYADTGSFIVLFHCIKTSQQMLKADLILQFMNQIDDCLKEKRKK